MPKLRVITKTPPEPQGEPEQQVAQLRDYLLQLCEELAYVLTHLEADNINDSTFERIQEMIPKAYTGLPPMDGEASSGGTNAWSRGDHRHPHDDSKADADALADHVEDTANPHSVTKAQVGLSDVANERQYSALNPPPTPSASDVGAIPTTEKGSAGGVAELDANGMVPSAQLPSYVDDVLEYASQSVFPATGESEKIYVALDTNKTYRWSGSAYVEISESLALGETSSTAYRGDRGKTAYDHSQVTSGNPHNVTAAEVGARPDTWTPSASDVGAQPTITASGMLKGDGLGGVSAATAGTDYQAPLTAGVDYQTPLVAGTDYATPAQLADKANQAQLATVETGSTASRAYAVGEYFCLNGLLYRVTTAISSGGTFTPGTNCELRTNGGFNDCAFSGTVTTGSIHDITKSGIYYLGGAVTDKPSQYGGMYIVAAYSSLVVGIFVDVVYGSTYSINYFNGTWYSHQL